MAAKDDDGESVEVMEKTPLLADGLRTVAIF
jgi:hypothetical protein